MMTKWIDFKKIKSEVGMERILGHYGLLDNLKRKGKNLIGVCPIHEGSNPTQFHASLEKNNFNCFGDCHGGGNVLDFVIKMEGVELREAGLMIQEWFGMEARRPKKGAVKNELEKPELIKEKKEVPVNTPLKFALTKLDADHPYLQERGLAKKTIEHFGLGYCEKGIMAGRVAIPIHNNIGELVAYVGRWPGDPPEGEGKYKIPAGFYKSLTLFNLRKAKDLAKEKGLIVVEGFFDCMRVWQAGFKNVVALMGSFLSEEQERLILEAAGSQGKIILMFDEDEAGRACRDDALIRLATEVFVRYIKLPEEGDQPDKLSVEKIREVLER